MQFFLDILIDKTMQSSKEGWNSAKQAQILKKTNDFQPSRR